ncbi:NADH dehydrogenase (ubiquinone) 15 kDa subunit isoform X2 [Tachypleus tridentatus]|uniref:NADH dehydrogenase (ubiquinone) 15 kDa subunit isoform X2 n=1 Tax=Tachypleus tridentatus TaxID=6853 RepID=UPI003FD026D2
MHFSIDGKHLTSFIEEKDLGIMVDKNLNEMSFIRTPFTDFFGCLGASQGNLRCRDFELNMMNCLEAYGLRNGSEMCKNEIDDYKECRSQKKQIKRVEAMQKERQRQYKSGERSKSNLYAEPPKLDSYYDYPPGTMNVLNIFFH